MAPIHVIPARAGIHFFSPQIAPISADFNQQPVFNREIREPRERNAHHQSSIINPRATDN